ncbi:hypothetical protein BAUCODRAFT_326011 [Baudoinia panamericana UAMH 10762]|uniref:Uncharacterized protein n=1 Tax=Baudoinia panamericana (strain UAMH 10762) TaxID=717646 RepID=M2MYJ8_BAUPA|nr:uncharacterized protein BAUCODRAFT_326011 [Baudoinia panamericana UAMH 10762]EMC91375.1 hypothetical protein BAUCODRAFT_326011 [Baudoinia panamericana UAMH 10762]
MPDTIRIRQEKVLRLERPVVVPQLDVPPIAESVPFQRCYADVLAGYNVPMTEFVSFLDGLAIAQAPNSALQGLKVVGGGLTKLPLPLLGKGLGHGINALAGSGAGFDSARARLYLTKANKEYFAPRNLRLSIVKDEELHTRVLGLAPGTPRLAPLMKETLTISVCDRRFAAIKPHVADLRYNVPSESRDIKTVDVLAKKHLASRMSRSSKDLAKMREDQWRGRGFEGAMEEVKMASRLRWLVIEDMRPP